MEGMLLIVLFVLGAIFASSFAILMVLCHYKKLRKKTAAYVKRLARTDLNLSDIELIHKEDSGKYWGLTSPQDSEYISRNCDTMLKLCDAVNAKQLGPSDFDRIHRIIQIANSISEKTSSDDSAKVQLLERKTTKLLIKVSDAISQMDQQLKALKETSIQHLDLLSQNSMII